jgi:hypothetical protein
MKLEIARLTARTVPTEVSLNAPLYHLKSDTFPENVRLPVSVLLKAVIRLSFDF